MCHQEPIKNIPFTNWPIPQARDTTLWLSRDATLQPTQSSVTAGQVSYQSDAPAQQVDADPEYVEFLYTFAERSRLIGPVRATLYMSCPDHDEMDVFVILRKADATGKVLRNVNIPLRELGIASDEEVEDVNSLKYIGPSGVLRASHRALDTKLSKPHWPAHDHTREQKVSPGEVVRLDIGLWPAAIQFEAGEKLLFRVAGHQMVLAEFPPLRGQFGTGNKGIHEVHFGGNYESLVVLPLVPV